MTQKDDGATEKRASGDELDEKAGAESNDADAEREDEEEVGAKADAKKERVLHTRIPAVLEAELKAAARALRMPVSNLVRTILEDAVAIADRASERVEDRLNRAARTVHDQRDNLRSKVKKDLPDDVVAYQPVVMAVDGSCAKCGVELAIDDDAALAVTSIPRSPSFVCKACLPAR